MKTIRIILIVVGLVALIVAGFYIIKIIKHAQPVPASAVSMDYPLKNGKFWVVQSGKNGRIHAIPSEKFALDIVRYPTLKTWFRFRQGGLQADPSFGIPIYAPCKGTVLKVEQKFPDVAIGISGRADEANFVAVRCDGYGVSMVHFKQNSVLVKVGDIVSAGELIGQMGNSGHTDGPHLHIAAFKIDSRTQETINVPITFNGRYFYRDDSFTNSEL